MDRNLRIGILSSIVASFLFIYLLDPILSTVGRVVVFVASKTYSSYVDGLVQQMATGVESKLILWVIVVITCVCATPAPMLLGFYAGALRAAQTRLLKSKPQSPELDPSDDAADEDEGDRHDHGLRYLRLRLGLAVLMTAVLVSTLVVAASSYWYCLKASTSFRQHLAIVSPYLTEDEEEIFRARWAAMAREADYLSIQRDLQVIATRNRVKLPPNRLFSSGSLL